MTANKRLSNYLLSEYPNRVPVLLIRAPKCKLPEPERRKLLVPQDRCMNAIINLLRSQLLINSYDSLYFYSSSSVILMPSMLIGDVYERHKSEDGLLRIIYNTESTFGC